MEKDYRLFSLLDFTLIVKAFCLFKIFNWKKKVWQIIKTSKKLNSLKKQGTSVKKIIKKVENKNRIFKNPI